MSTSDGAIAACATDPSAGAAASASACFSMPRWTLVSTSRCVRTGGPGGRVTAYVADERDDDDERDEAPPRAARHPGQPGRGRAATGAAGEARAPGRARRGASLAPGATAVSIAGGAVTRATFSTVRFLRPERQGLSSLHRIRRSEDVAPARRVDKGYAVRRVPAERSTSASSGRPSRPPRPPCARASPRGSTTSGSRCVGSAAPSRASTPLVDPAVTEPLRDELRWAAGSPRGGARRRGRPGPRRHAPRRHRPRRPRRPRRGRDRSPGPAAPRRHRRHRGHRRDPRVDPVCRR